MDPVTQQEVAGSARQAAINGLAIVGFVALVAAGIWLALYSTRFVPGAVNRIGQAAVYLGSVFTPARDQGGLTVVPTQSATTTISFGDASSTPATPAPAEPTHAGTPASTSGSTVTATRPAPVAGYGLADLSVAITAIGYQTDSQDSTTFVASPTVPANTYPALQILVKNGGTNWSGTWSIQAAISRDAQTMNGLDSLAPGAERVFTAAVEGSKGSEQTVTVTVSGTSDSNESNNSAQASITIQ